MLVLHNSFALPDRSFTAQSFLVFIYLLPMFWYSIYAQYCRTKSLIGYFLWSLAFAVFFSGFTFWESVFLFCGQRATLHDYLQWQ